MNFDRLIHRMNIATLSMMHVHDLAVSADKLMSWDKGLWSLKPRLSTGANRPDLGEKELPLCLEMSDEHRKVVALVIPQPDDNGKTSLFHKDDYLPIHHIVATHCMLYNYCMLEEYEFYQYNSILKEKIFDLSTDKYSLKDIRDRGLETLVNGLLEREQSNYERKGPTKRISMWDKLGVSTMGEDFMNLYETLCARRNELTHNSAPPSPTLEEAVAFFHAARVVAREIALLFNDGTVQDCGVQWEKFEIRTHE